MSFKQFLTERSASFQSLPDVAPYGFWIAPDGTFWVVSQTLGHFKVGRQINKEVFGLDSENMNFAQTVDFLLYEKYFMRVVTGYDPIYYYEVKKNPTSSQKRVLRDLGEWYEREIKEDKFSF